MENPQLPPNLPPNFNYYGQNPNFPNENKKGTGAYGLWVSVANIGLYLLLAVAILMTMKGAGFIMFYVGLFFSFLNMIAMIIFIALKKTGGWIAALIFMLLFPLLGFFTCTLSVSMH
jgi:hypothetical protein